MNQEFNKKKRTIIIGLAGAVVVLAGGLFITIGRGAGSKPLDTQAASVAEAEPSVSVAEIETEATLVATETSTAAAESKPSESETAAETEPVQAESAESPTTAAVTKPAATEAARVRTPEEAVPPAEPPASEVAAAPVENPDGNGVCQPEPTHPATEQPQGGETNSSGAVYVPGFGYIEPSGTVEGETAYTDGDWDKQIGTMD